MIELISKNKNKLKLNKNKMNNEDLFDILWVSSQSNIELHRSIFKNKMLNIITIKEVEVVENREEKLLQNFETRVKNRRKLNLKSKFFFMIKYFATCASIFTVLLLVSNFTTYADLVKDIIDPSVMQNKNIKMDLAVNTKSSILDATNVTASGEIDKWLTEEIKILKNSSVSHSIEKINRENEDEKIGLDIDFIPYENRIVIPKIAKNVPLLDVQDKHIETIPDLEKIFMDELKNWIIRYPWSAKPGQIWNSFIFGHSSNFSWVKSDYNSVFANLDKLEVWDEIISYYNQVKYTYVVKEKTVIKPWDVEILKRNNNVSELTLMTCWPIGTSLKRLLVIAELKK